MSVFFNMKKKFEIEYQPSNITPQEANFRLFKALSMLINEDDIYEYQDDENK